MSPLSSDWRDYRHDSQLSGRLPATATHIRSISITATATLDIGGGMQEIVIVPDGSGDFLTASSGGIQRYTADGAQRWATAPFGAHGITGVFDLDCDGALEIVTSNAREILILAASSGKFQWSAIVGPPVSYGTYSTMIQVHALLAGASGMQLIVPCFSAREVLVFDCSRGSHDTYLLHTLWMNDSYHPTTCIGDVNHDGIEEIVIARLGGVYVFDPVSGRMLNATQWSSDSERRRNYGHFELADIDGDGDLEAVILSDRVSRHIAVLDNDGTGNFTPLWDRFIQHIYPTDTTELRYVNNSVCDINGDGRSEICVSLFNESEDERWHLLVLDSGTGETLFDHEDLYLHDVVRSFTSTTFLVSVEPNRIPRKLSELRAIDSNGVTIFERERSRFLARTARTTATRAQFKPDIYANDGVWSLEEGGFAIELPLGNEVELQSFDRHAKLGSTWLLPCEGGRVQAVDREKIFYCSEQGELFSMSRENKPVCHRLFRSGYHLTTEAHIAARPGPVATVISHEATAFICVPRIDSGIDCYTHDGDAMRLAWHAIGHGKLGYDNVYHAASIVEWKGESFVAIVQHDAQHAMLSFYSLQGERHAVFDFPQIPSSVAGTRIGIYDWQRFEHSSGPALAVSAFLSPSMNAEYTCAISLASGAMLWEMERIGEGDYGRGVGPWGASSIVEREGSSELLFCAKDTIMRIDLEHGELLQEPLLLTSFTADAMRALGTYKPQGLDTWSSIEDPFTAYGSILPFDVDHDGTLEYICAGSFGGFGVLNNDFTARWWKVAHFGDVVYRLPAICNAASGTFLYQGHSNGTIAYYNAANGMREGELQIGAIMSDIIACDIDGDGTDEAIGATNDGRLLVMKFEDRSIRVIAEYRASGGIGSPSIAVIDGRLQIFVVSADGRLHVLSIQ